MLYLCYLCQFKPLRDHLRGFLIAAWAGDKIAEFSFPEISFHFPLRPWFFFVSPAYAGKSPARFSSPRRCRDHPRVCGEKTFLEPKGQTRLGSPPRVRGKGCNLARGVRPDRITPAYAGKSAQLEGASPLAQDHPRVCGEKESVNDGTAIRAGSPPRMRGKARSCQANTSVTRITPAYAGKSRRVREPDTQTAGSPPRMRGKGLKSR